jgi:hypothetical protein
MDLLRLFRRDADGQQGDPLSPAERTFIQDTAFPVLDRTKEKDSLERLTDGLWQLCQWERQRTSALDAKASSLTSLSSLAAAVMAASTFIGREPDSWFLTARAISVGLFIITVLLSLNAQRVVKLGAFVDAEVFRALDACHTPVGVTPSFSDGDPYRCFLRETALQRWMVYRTHCDQNDAKYRVLPASVHEIGGRPAYGHGREDGSWHD